MQYPNATKGCYHCSRQSASYGELALACNTPSMCAEGGCTVHIDCQSLASSRGPRLHCTICHSGMPNYSTRQMGADPCIRLLHLLQANVLLPFRCRLLLAGA